MEQRYNKLVIKSPIEYSYLFSNLRRLSDKEVLTQYSRNQLTQMAVLLNREYCHQPAMKLCAMLDSRDRRFKDVYDRITDFLQIRANSGIEYVVAFENLSLELLRRAYSIGYQQFDDNESPADIDKLQYETVMLITQINEDLMKCKIADEQQKDLAILVYTNNASSYDILHYDMQNEYLYQLIQSVYFFRLLEGNVKYKGLLEEFYFRYGIKNWREYVRTLSSIFCISKDHAGYIKGSLDIDVDSLITPSVLDKISIDCNIDKIPYKSKDEYDKEGNSDYRIFRSKPIIKLKNGDYAVHSRPLLTDRLYSSLYFDFIEIAESITTKHPDIPNLFTSEFVEKVLFGGLLKRCLSDIYTGYDEEALKKIHKITDGELGYPDYLLKSKKGVILFECKDIRVNAWIKEQRNYDLIATELRNKLVCKTYKLDYKNKKHVDIKPKRIGCGQIAGHVGCIRKGQFPWDSTLQTDVVVYPVLVIADNRLLVEGLTTIIQRWMCECLVNEGLDPNKEKPLIILSPLTILKYHELFKKNGFERYFEEYFQSIRQLIVDRVSAINTLISFDDFMGKYPFHLKELGNELNAEILADRKVIKYDSSNTIEEAK